MRASLLQASADQALNCTGMPRHVWSGACRGGRAAWLLLHRNTTLDQKSTVVLFYLPGR
jgi:hypothetical protein